MKIVYISDLVTDHIRAFLASVAAKQDIHLAFVETRSIEDQKMFQTGYAYYNALQNDVPENFRIIPYVSDGAPNPEAADAILKGDVVIIGNAKDASALSRLKNHKLTFRAHERWYQKPLPWYAYPRAVIGGWLHHARYKNLYMLCASAYTCQDTHQVFCFRNKTYRWGYFPETKRYDIEELMHKKNVKKILWCGRFVDRKHPDDAVKVALRLHHEGYDFDMDFIGAGEMENTLRKLILDHDLSDKVHLLGAMKSTEVRSRMETAGIYLFTSDFGEGWGAVLNESMNSGCAVVASHAIGSVPYLLDHKKNGLIYENGRVDALYRKVKYLLDHPAEQKRLGINAYKTITELWNADVAAKRFLRLVLEIKDHGYCDLYEEGPCSRAPILKNNWFKEPDEDLADHDIQ